MKWKIIFILSNDLFRWSLTFFFLFSSIDVRTHSSFKSSNNRWTHNDFPPTRLTLFLAFDLRVIADVGVNSSSTSARCPTCRADDFSSAIVNIMRWYKFQNFISCWKFFPSVRKLWTLKSQLATIFASFHYRRCSDHSSTSQHGWNSETKMRWKTTTSQPNINKTQGDDERRY